MKRLSQIPHKRRNPLVAQSFCSRMNRHLWLGVIIGLPLSFAAWDAAVAAETARTSTAGSPSQFFVYIGTYTQRGSKGIYLFQLNAQNGKLTPIGIAAEVKNPSFLAIHPDHQHLYAVGEMESFEGKPAGAVSAFQIDPKTGKLTLLNQQSSVGGGPCHISVDKEGKNVLVANYGGGSVAVLPILPDGKLKEASSFIQHQGSSVNPQRQKEPHAHSINLDALNRYAFVADLGLDKIFIYQFDGTAGKLTPGKVPFAAVKPGAGPRHFAFHPQGNWAYVINELDSTVNAFHYLPERGQLETTQTISTLPDGFTGTNDPAEVQVHPSGKFLYGSNRGHDSLVIYSIDPSSGKLTLVGHESTRGKSPRNFGIDPSGRYLIAANQDSNNLVLYQIDEKTGRLAFLQELALPMPVCVKFLAR
jgi:6-phosphogluconolactonase